MQEQWQVKIRGRNREAIERVLRNTLDLTSRPPVIFRDEHQCERVHIRAIVAPQAAASIQLWFQHSSLTPNAPGTC